MADHGLVVTCEFAESPAAISLNMASAVPPVLPLLAWQPWGCRIVPHDEPALEARDALLMCKVSAYTESQRLLANGSVCIVVVAVVAACDRVANMHASLYHPGKGGLAMHGDDLMSVGHMPPRPPSTGWPRWP